MSRRPSRSHSAILIFGEDANDRAAVAELVAALRPELSGRLRLRRQPITLVKNMNPRDAKKRVEKLKAAILADQAKEPVQAVLLHEDADAVEPAHEPLLAHKERPFASFGCTAFAVVPAWELETWWFLFPEAVASVRKTWRVPDQYVGRNVGKISNSKEKLVQCLRPPRRGSGFRDYVESDSKAVAAAIRASGTITLPRAVSHSWQAFVGRVQQL